MTFSVVGQDGDAFGVAVASRFLAVGAVVPAAEAGVGAVATQAMARVASRREVLDLLRAGDPADEAVAEVTGADPDRAVRQLGVVGAASQSTWTGSACLAWAGGRSGRDERGGYAIQGNILTGEEVVVAMERAWVASAGEPLPRRLVTSLLAGDAAGGDSRGRQAAALYAAAPGAGYDASGVLADLRVDDAPNAPTALARLLDEHELVHGGPEEVLALTGDLAAEVGRRLESIGYADEAEDPSGALAAWASVRNVEMRIVPGGIDTRVLATLRAEAP